MVALIKTLQVILALSVLIIVHELGHFLWARLFGIKVDKFYLFFDAGGKALARWHWGETEFGIGWIPFGGYCKISGMIDESMDLEQMKQEPKEWEFRSKPAWKRLFVMAGGVVNNFIFAVLVYIIIAGIWGEAYISNEDAQIAPNVYLIPHKDSVADREIREGIARAASLSVKENGRYRYDSFEHERSLVFDTPEGLFVMNSCSHGGADNIVKEIAETFPGKKIHAILGGFHLFRCSDDTVRAFAMRLRELDVQKIYTGHCTGQRAFEILKEVLGERAEQMFTGMTI